MDKTTSENDARVLWSYMLLNESPYSADVMLVLGSSDERVAERAAELSQQYDYGLVIFSGGIAHTTEHWLRKPWRSSEAEHFYNVFKKTGGRARAVLLETAAQNTGQNVILSYELLKKQNLSIPSSVQIVTKPYMERRVRATFDVQWPDHSAQLFVTSPRLQFDEYFCNDYLFEKHVSLMVGDFQRIVEYPKRGLQSRQKVPRSVRRAWARLVAAGYTKYLVK